MHSSTRVILPAAFEVAEIDDLALLIGNSNPILCDSFRSN